MREAATPSRPPLALIANDQEWTARSLESILAPAGYAILRAYHGSQALEQARAARPDLVILDLDLPTIPGIEVCRRLREDPRIPTTTPILITHTGPSIRDRRLEAFRAGAWELLALPVDAEEFLMKVDVYVRAKMDADRATEQSLLDEASGLYNARGVLRRARELGSEAFRHGKPLACVVFAPQLGLNGQGAVGEPGVETAPAAAHRLVKVFRESGRLSDVVGRLGPTEFVVMAAGTDPSGVWKLAERFLQAAEQALKEDGGATTPVQMRAGCYAVSDFRTASQTALQPVDLLVRATMAVRRAQTDPEAARIRFFNHESGQGSH